MSTTEAIQVQDYIERIAETYEASLKLFPADTDGEPLVTKVIRNQPALLQSSDEGIIPYIVIFPSRNVITEQRKVGRDTRDVEGQTIYEVEIYSVCVVGGKLNTQFAQKQARIITQAMRDALGRNLRLAIPATKLSPICKTHTRYEVPYILPGTAPKDMIAMNVVVRAQVGVALNQQT